MKIYEVTYNNISKEFIVVENRGTPTPMGKGKTAEEAVGNAYAFLCQFGSDFCITPAADNFAIRPVKSSGNSGHITVPKHLLGKEVYLAEYTGD